MTVRNAGVTESFKADDIMSPNLLIAACSNTVISQVYFESLGGYLTTRQFKMISNIGVACEKIISWARIYSSLISTLSIRVNQFAF